MSFELYKMKFSILFVLCSVAVAIMAEGTENLKIQSFGKSARREISLPHSETVDKTLYVVGSPTKHPKNSKSKIFKTRPLQLLAKESQYCSWLGDLVIHWIDHDIFANDFYNSSASLTTTVAT